MKWLIINTESFSASTLFDEAGKKMSVKDVREVSMGMLPKALLKFLQVFHYPYIILDESSKIKTNTPMPEYKKSIRCRLIKLLHDTGERTILTGTLKSKSPLNVYDQYGFLDPFIFPETMYEFAERYCIMITIRIGRGRRVQISQKDWDKIRRRLANAYRRGGEAQLEMSKASVFKEYTINEENMDWIIAHQKFTPFIHQDELIRRIAPVTMFVKRSDVFDIAFEKFVDEPIVRYVEISAKAKAMGNELVELGFTDTLTLGKAPALELMHRLQDICNGFEPHESEVQSKTLDVATGTYPMERVITYTPFDDNPKLDEVFSLLDEIGTEENQVAIASSRVNFLEAIKERLEKEGIPFTHYEGDNKAEAEEAFTSGEARVFLSGLKPAAYGLNCLSSCDYAIAACVDSSTEEFFQWKHRLLRGQLTHPKFAYHICVKNSVEEKVIRSLNTGVDLINYTNDKKTFMFS